MANDAAQSWLDLQCRAISGAPGTAIVTRASSLVAAVFSAVPMWGRVDPLAVLALSQKERKMRERKLRAVVDREDRYIGILLDTESAAKAERGHAADESVTDRT